MGRPYRQYRTVTREAAFARGFDGAWIDAGAHDRSWHYDYRRARQICAEHAEVEAVDFCMPLHNDSRTRYRPAPGIAIYVKATGGAWGKRARLVLPKLQALEVGKHHG